MTDTASNQWHELIGGAFAFKFDAFQQVAVLPDGLWFALLVVLLSGLSLAIAQSIILFISRVKPGRFVFSLLLNAVLFTVGFIFLTFSTWLICLLPGSAHVSFLTLIKVFGLGYAPLLFGFLGALPYLGNPIGNLLSVWNLLAMVVGLAAVTQLEAGAAFIYMALGWGVKQLAEGTIGQPITRLGQQIADLVAGVSLADTAEELREQLLAGVNPARSMTALNHPLMHLKNQARGLPASLKLVLSLLAMAIAFVVILLLLRPIRNGLFGWYTDLHGLWRLIFDLVWIGVVAIVFAGFLAPLESLGWWAGWYGHSLRTAASGTAGFSSVQREPVDRYLVYLDGIGQSGGEYTPDIEAFLTKLKPALPPGVELVRGLMMYSVLNKPLDQDRPLAFLWRLANRMRLAHPAALLGLLVNLRNLIIVAVSSDKRYGPVYNQGIAQVILDGLMERGYSPGSGVPITLLGYSGGGEMSVAAAPYLKRSTGAPIEVISLGGVMSANNNLLKLEHLYHIVGDKDMVERIGPIMFPGRWKIFPLSYWNRSKRKGKISILSAGPVGHQVPGGYLDPQATLPDGRTYLQHTIDLILQILRG